jgi:hypothetical protein
MIIGKSPLPDDPTPSEAPPSYDAVDPGAKEIHLVEKGGLGPIQNASIPRSPISPVSKSPSSSTSLKGKGKVTNWFNFGASRTTREVRTTVLRLVRDLVREQHATGGASMSILESCAEACAGHSVTLSTLLQENSIENHTPLYWAIVNRPPDNDSAVPDLLTSLISFASPLTPETISDIRHACLLTSDQPLFQRLRMSPEFAPLSGTDEMLLGGSISPDDITVEDIPGDERSFAVNFEIVHFQKRMLVSKYIILEFIARGASSIYLRLNSILNSYECAARMWQLTFSIAQDSQHGVRPGSWCINLSLLENSPPTWVDSRLIIPEPTSGSSPPGSPSSASPSSTSPSLLDRVKTKRKPKPTIVIRLKPSQQLVPLSLGYSYQQTTSVVVSLEDNTIGSSLQYA